MNLLVALDLSESSAAIVQRAEQLAVVLSAHVYLLHVAEPEPDFVGYDVGPQTVRDSLAEKFHQEHRQIQDIAAGLRELDIDATGLLVAGPTVETILSQAQKLTPEMIIVGSHGAGAMARLLVGSVSEGVLRGSDWPVLVIPTRR